jgi:hypothetical protein
MDPGPGFAKVPVVPAVAVDFAHEPAVSAAAGWSDAGELECEQAGRGAQHESAAVSVKPGAVAVAVDEAFAGSAARSDQVGHHAYQRTVLVHGEIAVVHILGAVLGIVPVGREEVLVARCRCSEHAS